MTIFGSDPSFYAGETIDREIESLVRYYQTEGFLNVSITGSVASANDGGETVALEYLIVEGPATKIGTVTVLIAVCGIVPHGLRLPGDAVEEAEPQ